jgi:hypothetical protein
VFLITYSMVPLLTPTKFALPDEGIGYFFSRLYAETGELSYPEEANELAEGVIHIRNTTYLDGQVVSNRYVGFCILGGTVGVVSLQAMRFLTPLLAIVGAFFLYLLTRDLFNKNVATLTFLLVLIFSPFWYWSSWSMMDNVAACSMFIIASRYLFKIINGGSLSHYVLAGFFLGLAMLIRPELVLITPTVMLLLLWHARKVRWTYVGLMALCLCAALCPFLAINHDLYGSWLTTGQHVRYDSSNTIPISRFSALNLLENSANIAMLTPLLAGLIVLGLFHCLKRRSNLPYVAFAVAGLAIIALYFLSGRVCPSEMSSGYTRYLLPVSVLCLPLVSCFIVRLNRKPLTVLLVALVFLISAAHVVPSISAKVNDAWDLEQDNERIVGVTPSDAIVFLSVSHKDKTVFPERRVALVGELPQDNRVSVLAQIVMDLSLQNIPVYILGNRDEGFTAYVPFDDLKEELAGGGLGLVLTSENDLYAIERL